MNKNICDLIKNICNSKKNICYLKKKIYYLNICNFNQLEKLEAAKAA